MKYPNWKTLSCKDIRIRKSKFVKKNTDFFLLFLYHAVHFCFPSHKILQVQINNSSKNYFLKCSNPPMKFLIWKKGYVRQILQLKWGARNSPNVFYFDPYPDLLVSGLKWPRPMVQPQLSLLKKLNFKKENNHILQCDQYNYTVITRKL